MPYDRTIQDRSKPPRYIGRDVKNDRMDWGWKAPALYFMSIPVVSIAMVALHYYGR